MHFICFFQFVNGNLLLSFLFQKFANFLFIVMAINTKGLWYFLSFVFYWFVRRLLNFLKQLFSCHREFPFVLFNRFFHVFECGNHTTFDCFFNLSHGSIYVIWVKMKCTYCCIIYTEFIFPSSSPKPEYALKRFLSSVRSFWKMKGNYVCFNFDLVILRVFAVRPTTIVTTATAVSFFRSFSCFVWNFLVGNIFPPFLRF